MKGSLRLWSANVGISLSHSKNSRHIPGYLKHIQAEEQDLLRSLQGNYACFDRCFNIILSLSEYTKIATTMIQILSFSVKNRRHLSQLKLTIPTCAVPPVLIARRFSVFNCSQTPTWGIRLKLIFYREFSRILSFYFRRLIHLANFHIARLLDRHCFPQIVSFL